MSTQITTTADGCQIPFEVFGPADGPPILMSYPYNEGTAQMLATFEVMSLEDARATNQRVLDLLVDRYRVVRFEYPRGSGGATGPFEDDLKPETVATDHDAVAIAAGVDRYVVVGYSLTGSMALQVAGRTSRCAGVAIGGFPPLDGPYQTVADTIAAQLPHLPPEAGLPFMRAALRYYRDVADHWDERAAVSAMTGPRVVVAGSEDQGDPARGMVAPLGQGVVDHADELRTLGWDVVVLDGLDHLAAGDPDVFIPAVRKTLDTHTW